MCRPARRDVPRGRSLEVVPLPWRVPKARSQARQARPGYGGCPRRPAWLATALTAWLAGLPALRPGTRRNAIAPAAPSPAPHQQRQRQVVQRRVVRRPVPGPDAAVVFAQRHVPRESACRPPPARRDPVLRRAFQSARFHVRQHPLEGRARGSLVPLCPPVERSAQKLQLLLRPGLGEHFRMPATLLARYLGRHQQRQHRAQPIAQHRPVPRVRHLLQQL